MWNVSTKQIQQLLAYASDYQDISSTLKTNGSTMKGLLGPWFHNLEKNLAQEHCYSLTGAVTSTHSSLQDAFETHLHSVDTSPSIRECHWPLNDSGIKEVDRTS